MNQIIKTIVAFGLLCSSTFAQIELSYTKVKTIVGATSPEVLDGGRILVEDDSKIAISTVAVIKVASTERVRLRAQKALREYAKLIPLGESIDSVSKIITSRYLLAGEGSFVVDGMSVSWDRTIDVVLGPPIPPTPDPPKPPDPPDPVKSFRVILVKESGSTLSAEQTAIAGSKQVRDYLTSKTTPEGGLAGWREYDHQQNTTNEQSTLKALWVASKSSITKVPCMIVEVNGKAKIVDYPKNVAEAIKTLKDYGGN